jgi:hypothetical protein
VARISYVDPTALADPELVDRLTEAAEWTRAEMGAACRCPLRLHPNGVAFALALGQRALFFRLPPERRVGMVDLGFGDLVAPEWISAAAPPPDLTKPEGARRVEPNTDADIEQPFTDNDVQTARAQLARAQASLEAAMRRRTAPEPRDGRGGGRAQQRQRLSPTSASRSRIRS